MKYNRLREVREQQGKTQLDIAELLQMAQSQYARYETGARELPMHHFLSLAKYYDISLDYLSGLIDTPLKLSEKRVRKS